MINRGLRDHCAGSFHLRLNADQIRTLIDIDRGREELSFLATGALERRGLADWPPLEKAPVLTTAGQLVLALLREAGMCPVFRKPRQLREAAGG